MAFVIDRSLYLSPEVVVEPGPKGPLVGRQTFTPDLVGLIAWLELQPQETVYDESDAFDCLMCRFASAVTGRRANFGMALKTFRDIPDEERLQLVSYGRIWGDKFGDKRNIYSSALSRARKLLAERTP